MKKSLLLVVDDNPGFLRLFTRRFCDSFRVMTAENGKNAVLVLNSSLLLPDLIVSDLEMPEMNGYQFLKYLKESKLFSNIPIIMLTSREDGCYKTKCLKNGAL